MPNRCFHGLYYMNYLDLLEEERRAADRKKKEKSEGNSKADHAKNFQGQALAEMRAAREAMEQLQDEM